MKKSEYRKKAFDVLYDLLPVDAYTETDNIIENEIRKIRNLPPRPETREIYEGLFPISSSSQESNLITVNMLTKTGIALDSAEKWAKPLSIVAERYDIDNKLRICHFLAQLIHESGQFKLLVENLNYSAEGLIRTWPSRFNSHNANLYARQPEKIANFVYANRLGNGNTASGDGWKYRGRGLIQITGRSNYNTYGDIIGVDLVNFPERAVEVQIASELAGAYWTAKKLNTYADSDNINEITTRINGGLIGIDSRKYWLDRLKNAY